VTTVTANAAALMSPCYTHRHRHRHTGTQAMQMTIDQHVIIHLTVDTLTFSVRFVGGLGGLTPTGWWRPPTSDCKVWSGGSDLTPPKGPESKFVVKSLRTNIRHYSDPSLKTFRNGL